MIKTYKTNLFKEISKKIAFRYLGLGKPNYPYMLDPIQLSFLVENIDLLFKKLKRPLNIYEIGVARGMTTSFLASHIIFEDLPHKIFCIDTFSGFTEKDLNYETNHRGKTRKELLGFSYNDFSIWKQNFSNANFIYPIQCDISEYKFQKNQTVDIVLADVDLYLPTKALLSKFYEKLTKGGVILVDDVKNESCWDGAHQAYFEFCKELSLKPNLIGRKSGILKK